MAWEASSPREKLTTVDWPPQWHEQAYCADCFC